MRQRLVIMALLGFSGVSFADGTDPDGPVARADASDDVLTHRTAAKGLQRATAAKLKAGKNAEANALTRAGLNELRQAIEKVCDDPKADPAKCSGLREQVALLRTGLAATEGSLTEAWDSIGDLFVKTSGLGVRVSTLEVEMVQVQEGIVVLQEDVETLRTRKGGFLDFGLGITGELMPTIEGPGDLADPVGQNYGGNVCLHGGIGSENEKAGVLFTAEGCAGSFGSAGLSGHLIGFANLGASQWSLGGGAGLAADYYRVYDDGNGPNASRIGPEAVAYLASPELGDGHIRFFFSPGFGVGRLENVDSGDEGGWVFLRVGMTRHGQLERDADAD